MSDKRPALTLREQILLVYIAQVEAWELKYMHGWESELARLVHKGLVIHLNTMGLDLYSLSIPDGLLAPPEPAAHTNER